MTRRRSEFYHTYMSSLAWQDKRRRVLFRDGNQCQHCGSREYLEVHHLSYARLGCERLADLITLCRTCHQKQHQPASQRRKKRLRRYKWSPQRGQYLGHYKWSPKRNKRKRHYGKKH